MPHSYEIRHLVWFPWVLYTLELETFCFFIDLSLLGSFLFSPQVRDLELRRFNTLCILGILFARVHRGTFPANLSLGLVFLQVDLRSLRIPLDFVQGWIEQAPFVPYLISR